MLGQQFVNGLAAGSAYALFALGFTLIFGVMRVINLTYGVYFSAGALLALYLCQSGLSLALALPLASAVVGVAACLVDYVLLARLQRTRAPELSSLMVTLGATLLLYSIANSWLGTQVRRFPSAVMSGTSFDLFGIYITWSQILIIIIAASVVIALSVFLNFSRMGLAIRALAQNPDAARLMGVNVAALTASVSFICGALGALAGALLGLNYNAIQPYMGETMMLKGFAVIILGGLGDVRGALIAGLLIGILESLAAGYIASSLKDAIGFVLLVLTLWVRPSGLFGQVEIKRA
jgi:branched-chain amino acid transport system permease protein